jgi:hypothetical protein
MGIRIKMGNRLRYLIYNPVKFKSLKKRRAIIKIYIGLV